MKRFGERRDEERKKKGVPCAYTFLAFGDYTISVPLSFFWGNSFVNFFFFSVRWEIPPRSGLFPATDAERIAHSATDRPKGKQNRFRYNFPRTNSLSSSAPAGNKSCANAVRIFGRQRDSCTRECFRSSRDILR